VCNAIRGSKKTEAARALQLVQQALDSDKTVALSTVEKLIFVQSKAMTQFRHRYEVDIRGRVFQALTGRSRNWWDKHHSGALAKM
jgi:hypothetical protein